MSKEPIAIIGIGLRFPKVNNLSDFWDLLRNGVDAISKLNSNKRNIDSETLGGFLDNIDYFDTEFFNISPDEATLIDPQHRLLLEVAHSALEDAGLIPKSIAGKDVGVFIGIDKSDYSELINETIGYDFSATTGNNRAMAANRISYYFDFHGPSLVIDTACSSALVAVDSACCSLWNGGSSIALAGGVNLILDGQRISISKEKGLIAPDGVCKAFDAKADGYVQSEGLGLVVLKPLAQAKADGDRIYALIVGSGVNNNGRSNTLTSPNLKAQVELLEKVYRQAKINPKTINYVEAHATGTPIGDTLEMKALGAVIGRDRTPENPCRVGCVKTNIGHTEAASGIAGLIKVVLSLYYRQIPASLHFQQPSPYIVLSKLGLKVQQTLESLPDEIFPIRAGVSAFGFGGTNAHLILEEVASPVKIEANSSASTLQILTLTAKSQTALQDLVRRYQAFLNNQPAISLADICFTANTRRTEFNHRLAFITESKDQLTAQLNAYIQKESLPSIFNGQIIRVKAPPICFIFSGKSSELKQIIGLLYNTQPELRFSLAPCEAILYSRLEKQFLEIINEEHLDNSPYSKLVDFLVEYAITKLWKLWGIEPAIAIGYGTGNYLAATVAGILTLEEIIYLILGAGNLELIPNFKKAQIPLVSSVTGNIIQVNDVIYPELWQQEFDLGCSRLTELPRLLSDSTYILLDIYSGHIKNSEVEKTDSHKINSDNLYTLFSTLITLWLLGAKVNWSGVRNYQECRTISLPTYPFEHQSYWINSSFEISSKQSESYVNPRCHQTIPSQDISKYLDVEFVAPRNQVERQLGDIWAEVLQLQTVGIEDNFFDLGGNSLLAVNVSSKIQQRLNCSVPVATLYQYSTIKELAQTIDKKGPISSWSSLFPIQQQGSKPPLFFVNSISYALRLGSHIGLDNPFYCLNIFGLTEYFKNQPSPLQFKEISAKFIKDMQTIQSQGPYFLATYCGDSFLTLEIAQQLQAQGQRVALVVLIDSIWQSNGLKFNFHWQNFRRFGLDYIREKVRNHYRLFKNKFARSANKMMAKIYRKNGDVLSNYLDDLELLKSFEKVRYTYPDKLYTGKVTLFLSSELSTLNSSKLSSMIDGEMEIQEISGYHHTIFEEPYIQILVEKLRSSIDKALL